MFQLSLRNKLLFFAVALAIIPLVFAGRTMIRITQDELKSSINDELNITAEQLSAEIDNWFYNAWLAPLLMLRNAIDDERLGVEEKIALLTLGITEIGDIVQLQITVAGSSDPIVVMNDTFKRHLSEAGLDPIETVAVPKDQLAPYIGRTGRFIGELVYIAETDVWMTTIILPLFRQLAEQDAVFSARINLGKLRQFLQDHPFQHTGAITLVNAEGNEILSQSRLNYSEFKIVRDAVSLVSSDTRVIYVEPYTRPNGDAMLGAFSFPRSFPWAVVLEKREEDAYLAVKEMVRRLFLWVVFGLAIAVSGAFVFSTRMSRPILEIDRVAREVGKGNLKVRVQGVTSRDEIGDLADRINQMIKGLVERFQLEKFVSGETLSAVKESDEGGVHLGGERRNLTVLFSDIRGFTAFSEKVPPEVVVNMLNVHLRHQADIVRRYQGDIDKFVGDELVAVFQGEDMLENSLLCALEIQDKMASLLKEHPDWDLGVGIGINTGDVIMGAMGSEERMDYTILGANVNLAARLCSSAAPGQILISQQVHEKIAHLEGVKSKQLDPIKARGISEPVHVYEMTRVGAIQGASEEPRVEGENTIEPKPRDEETRAIC